MYFVYGQKEITYLQSRDAKLAEVIKQIGPLQRTIDTDLFSSVVHHIVGQQISSKAQRTIWQRMINTYAEITPQKLATADIADLQAHGLTFKKAEYIKSFAEQVNSGAFVLADVAHMSDEDAIKALSSLKGIGVWTAEMLLLFCLQRQNVFSFDDLAIQRGLRMIYHHRKITKALFAKYRRRFSPYCSVASLYIWAVAGGTLPQMRDYAVKKSKKTERT